MRPWWMPVWVWRWTVYRPVLVRSITLRSERRRVQLVPGEDSVRVESVVVSFEDWRGRHHDVIHTGVAKVGGTIHHSVTSIGMRETHGEMEETD